jgi:hypothetical protein
MPLLGKRTVAIFDAARRGPVEPAANFLAFDSEEHG